MYLATTPLNAEHYNLKNRLVLPSCGTHKADTNGKVTEGTLDWFREKSRGFGLVVVEHSYVSQWGKAGADMLSISDDSDIEGLSRLAALLHENGCCAQIQLDHGAGWRVPELQTCLDLNKNPEQRRVTDSITDEQLMSIPGDFAAAALRAREAGFDGVQIKACHVYLLAQFYSPLTNKRTEGLYAGTSFESRFRLTYEVLKAVRQAVGPDYPVSVRFPVQDYTPGGSTLEESVRAAALLEEAGADLLDLSGGPKWRFFHPEKKEPGWFAEDAVVIKRAVHVPVLVTGGITEIDQAERILKAGQADLVGVCRAVLKDEGWCRRQLAAIGE
ncbi:MAG: NADH:flavin oxidoreductase [Oscillospiraceae bacterium]